MSNQLNAARIAALLVLATSLAQTAPAFARGAPLALPEVVTTPGFGTLGAILELLLQLFL
jgi:hypothetical protein